MSSNNFLVSVCNDIRIQRFIPAIGTSGPEVLRFCLGVVGDVGGSAGFVVPFLEVKALFDRTFGAAWNNRLLLERGETPPKSVFPPRFLNFSPSIEEFARVVGDTFAPLMKKLFNANLQFVRVIPITDPVLVDSSATYFIRKAPTQNVKVKTKK
ncbi:hypothetical protein [Marininema halotolerans]|uniref:Uncharacterized protein n=1 Tax=Marininema halotolerans TaxID=1155944 RepID=A0A1I6UB07_9BACL|nr:hypothetical protein [Marininema halotolerans]SFS98602.1 hypothetical protein SAMN05444972_1159 [Marininema halotolerans]